MTIYKEMKIFFLKKPIDKNYTFKINVLIFLWCFFFNLNYSVSGTNTTIHVLVPLTCAIKNTRTHYPCVFIYNIDFLSIVGFICRSSGTHFLEIPNQGTKNIGDLSRRQRRNDNFSKGIKKMKDNFLRCPKRKKVRHQITCTTKQR